MQFLIEHLTLFCYYSFGVIYMTMQKTTVNVEIDADVKDQAMKFLDQNGVDLASAIDLFLRQVIKERRLPFEPKAPQTPAEQILYHIERLGIPKIELPADENGHAYIDKEKHPDLYDWAVNG